MANLHTGELEGLDIEANGVVRTPIVPLPTILLYLVMAGGKEVLPVPVWCRISHPKVKKRILSICINTSPRKFTFLRNLSRYS